MARIRSLKPEFWDDRKLARSVSRDARMLYMGLWNQCDEHGRCQGDPVWIKGRVFPYDDDIDAAEVVSLLGELARAGRVVRYEVEGDPYVFLPKLSKHQRLESEKVPSRLPTPPDDDESESCADQSAPGPDESEPIPVDNPENTVSPAATVGADSSAPRTDESALLYVAGSRGQVAGGKGGPRKRATPIPDDWRPNDHHRSIANDLRLDLGAEVASFRDYDRSNGPRWKDHDAAFNNWLRNSRRFGGRQGPARDVDWNASLARAQQLDAAEGGQP